MTYTLIRGGRLVDGPADILIRGDTIEQVAKPETFQPGDFRIVDAGGRLRTGRERNASVVLVRLETVAAELDADAKAAVGVDARRLRSLAETIRAQVGSLRKR